MAERKGASLRAEDAGLEGFRPAGPAVPGSILLDLGTYWRLLIKHRLIIAAAATAALVLGLIITLMTTPTYSASITIQIDREAARVLDVKEVNPGESMIQGQEFFLTQYGLLKSRSLAERVSDSLGLGNTDQFLAQMDVDFPEKEGETAAQRTVRRKEATLAVLEENLTVTPVGGSRLVVLTFDSPNPDVAAQVANSFAENFIEENLERKFDSSSYARRFLEQRIAQTKTRLEETERQLVAYAGQQQIINIDNAQGNGSQSLAANNLVSLNNALAEARAMRVSAEAKWRQTQRTPARSLPEVLQNQTVQQLSADLARLQAQYQQNLQVYRPDYPSMLQLKSQIDELSGQIDTIGQSIKDSIRSQYMVAAGQENAIQGQVNALKGDVLNLRDRSIQYNILQRELDTTRTLYDGLLQRYKEVSVTEGVATNNVSVIDRAEPPRAPSKPVLVLNLALALLLGLGIGVVAVLIIEALDESLASPDDVEAKLQVPLLGVIPLLDKGVSATSALADPRSAFSEAYYSIRTALQFSTTNGAPSTMLITSSRPGEGKSTTAYALALNLARMGRNVLLVDGDLRNPSMHRLIGVSNDAGASNLLSGSATLESVVKPTGQAGLSFVPCGPLPPSPAELWAGDRLETVLAEASAAFDHVVIDGPPVLGFADAPILGNAVGGTVFVIESRGTRRAQARGALRRLAMGRSRLLGAVLTKFNVKTLNYGGYDYAYDYSYGSNDRKPGDGRGN